MEPFHESQGNMSFFVKFEIDSYIFTMVENIKKVMIFIVLHKMYGFILKKRDKKIPTPPMFKEINQDLV